MHNTLLGSLMARIQIQNSKIAVFFFCFVFTESSLVLILVQFQSNGHLQMTVEDFPFQNNPNLHAIFSTVTFRAEHLNLVVLSLF